MTKEQALWAMSHDWARCYFDPADDGIYDKEQFKVQVHEEDESTGNYKLFESFEELKTWAGY